MKAINPFRLLVLTILLLGVLGTYRSVRAQRQGQIIAGCVGNTTNCRTVNVDANGNLGTNASFSGSVGISGQPIAVTCNATNCPPGGPQLPGSSVAIVYSYENGVQGVTASPMTGTSSTQVIGGVASNYMYISSCSVGNTNGSVNTFVDLQDGSGGTVIYKLTAADNGGGESKSFGDHPIHVPTLGNGLFAADETTGANVNVSCNGFVSTNKYF